MITVRKAKRGDESAIFTLADKSTLKKLKQKKSKSGFIIYSKSPEQFFERIRVCKYFFVAMESSKIIGYLLANSLDELKKLKEDISYLEILGKFSRGKDVVYLDQLVVEVKHAGKGIGQRLLNHLYSQLNSKYVVGFIVHSPVRNQRSIDFFVKKNRWSLIREVQIENMKCGLYGYQV